MIQKSNLVLRAPEPNDLDLLYNWENNMLIWRVSNTKTPFSKYQLEQYIKSSSLDIYQTKQLRLMIDIEENNIIETVGMIDIFDFEPYHNRAGLGIMINEKWRSKGIATKALRLFINYATSELGIHNLYCNIEPDNEASLNLFISSGFEQTGRKKEWLKTQNGYKDELMFQFITSSSA